MNYDAVATEYYSRPLRRNRWMEHSFFTESSQLKLFDSIASLDSFLGEGSVAFSHKDTSKWFCFFPVRDIPLRFISLKLIFSAPIGRIHPIFVKTLWWVHDLPSSMFSAADFFIGEFSQR